MKYNVYISWKMSKCLEIEADSAGEAKDKADNMFNQCRFDVDEIHDYVPGSFKINEIEHDE